MKALLVALMLALAAPAGANVLMNCSKISVQAINCTAAPTPTPTPTATATPTATPTPTVTPTATPTSTMTATPTPTAVGTPVPGSAAAFNNITSVDDQYIASGETAAQQLAMVSYLGVRHVREDFICGNPQGCGAGSGDPISALVSNAHSGGYTYITQPNCANGTVSAQMPFLVSVEQAFGDTLFMAGGCNEPNNQNYSYNGVGCFENGTAQGCINFGQDYYTAIKAALPTIPVSAQPESPGPEPDNVGLQFLVNNGKVNSDFADVHNYLFRGSNTWVDGTAWSTFETGEGGIHDGMTGEFCGTTFGKGFAATPAASCPTIPRISTETGWSWMGGGATEAQRGAIILDGIVAGYMRGWNLVSLYVMYNNGSDGFRLFYSPTTTIGNLTGPSPAAQYLHNLTTILADPVTSFTPACTAQIPSGATAATDHWITLSKANSKCDFIFLPDRPTGELIETVTIPVTGSVYDPTAGTAAIATNTGTFQANDHVMIVEF